MLDFTKEITMEPKWNKYYVRTRALIYATFIIFVFFMAYDILFPTLEFNYKFQGPIASLSNNTILNPHDNDNLPLKKGFLAQNKKLFFDTTLMGNFSDVNINITFEKNPIDATDRTIKIRKSYQAFFYPTGKPVGFKEGSLISEGENFYMISNGKLSKFSSLQAMQTLGFTANMFTPVTPDELKYNEIGASIAGVNFPDGTIIAINNDYYQLKNKLLYNFVSKNAFLSRYDAILAIKQNSDFLDKYDIANEQIGLADGTLASIGTSVFILSDGKSYPVSDPQTFEAMGYDWKSVLSADSEEVGIYKKQKMFSGDTAHPTGTIFKDTKHETYYIVKNGEKHPIIGSNILASYLKITPVIIDTDSLNKFASCTIKKDLLSFRKYSCSTSLNDLRSLIGNAYRFETDLKTDSHISKLDVTFNTAFKQDNFKKSASDILSLVKSNYAQQK